MSYWDRDLRCFHCVTTSFPRDMLQIARSIMRESGPVKRNSGAGVTAGPGQAPKCHPERLVRQLTERGELCEGSGPAEPTGREATPTHQENLRPASRLHRVVTHAVRATASTPHQTIAWY